MAKTTHPVTPNVEKRLHDEQVIWLTTVRSDGQPQASPVWFWWDGKSFLIYSQPDNQKLRSIAANPRISLNLDGNGQGGDIVTVEGTAVIEKGAPPADKVPEYVEKYKAGIKRIGHTDDSFAKAYNTAIRVTPTRWRAW